MRTILRVSWTFVILTAAGTAAAGQAGDEPQPAPTSAVQSGTDGGVTIDPQAFLNTFIKGSVIHMATMWALVACSVVTLTIVLERLVALRASRVIPKTFVSRFLDRLRSGDLDRGHARDLCRDNGSPIANVFSVIVSHSGQPAAEIREAVTEAGQLELFHLRRRVRALHGMSTLSPLLGLFGTVWGMIESFGALSHHTGAGKTEMLAGGISLALFATAGGLLIAILAVAAYYFLLGRVDKLVQEMDVLASEVIDHVAAGGRAAEKAAPRPRVVPSREQASL